MLACWQMAVALCWAEACLFTAVRALTPTPSQAAHWRGPARACCFLDPQAPARRWWHVQRPRR